MNESDATLVFKLCGAAVTILLAAIEALAFWDCGSFSSSFLLKRSGVRPPVNSVLKTIGSV